MNVHSLDPLQDSRWSALVAQHPDASVFHTTAWLHSLQRTYGYRPVVFTMAGPDTPLDNSILFCEVRSWLTGSRLVSLPFSDHCEPLLTSVSAAEAIVDHLDGIRRDGHWKYIEIRPRTNRLASARGLDASDHFWHHVLDLSPPEETLFAACHKNAVRQQIGRARREGLQADEGVSRQHLQTFYQLLLLTRQRHHLPPQPLQWFRNLADAFRESMSIRVAKYNGQPIAAIVTLRHGNVMFYKYAASDARYHSLGGMQFLLWKAIQDARSTGCAAFDFGRSELDNEGLALFKDRWGATRSDVTYRRCGAKAISSGALRTLAVRSARGVLDRAPGVCRAAAGRFLYRHAG